MRVVPNQKHDCTIPSVLRRWASGIASLDAALAGGMAYGRVHEFYAAEKDDVAATAGFAMALTIGMGRIAPNKNRDILWLRPRRANHLGGMLQAQGWAELGGKPDETILATIFDPPALLRTTVDALRCSALGAVVVEGWGAMRELDLTASRRLSLAAEASGTPLFLLRIDANLIPSTAHTRWQVSAAPSRALPGQAPGRPTFDISLLRQRSGPSGLDWRLEWDRDQRIFRDAAVSGTEVPVPARRPIAGAGVEPFRQTDRRVA